MIGLEDLEDIARGAAILGARRRRRPYLGRLLAEDAIRKYGPVTLVSLDELADDAMVLPVAIMGAPTVIVEKPPAGTEFGAAVRALAGSLPSPATHIACLEAGGLNSMIPIATAAECGLPLVDGDGMGRAFPELQMVLFTLDGISSTPMAMADDKGNTVVLNTVDNAWSERLARPATVEMGCAAAIALYPHTGAQARSCLVPATMSLAGDLGALVRTSTKSDVAAALAESQNGAVLFKGRVDDVSRRTVANFARGHRHPCRTRRLRGCVDDAGVPKRGTSWQLETATWSLRCPT
ncbi:MAG: DUF917 domain-containing protein [Marmoricola sp.]